MKELKNIGEVVGRQLSSEAIIQPDFTIEQKKRVEAFVLSIFSLYGSKATSSKNPENLRPIMRAYAADITSLSDAEYNSRLSKVKKLLQAGHEDYQWPESALAKATGKLEIINHDYRQFYPTGSDAMAQRQVKELPHKPSDQAKAKQEISKIKELL